MRINCTECGQEIETPMAPGEQTACVECGSIFTVPSPASDKPTAEPAAAILELGAESSAVDLLAIAIQAFRNAVALLPEVDELSDDELAALFELADIAQDGAEALQEMLGDDDEPGAELDPAEPAAELVDALEKIESDLAGMVGFEKVEQFKRLAAARFATFIGGIAAEIDDELADALRVTIGGEIPTLTDLAEPPPGSPH